MQLKLVSIAKGLATHVPVVRQFACRKSGGTVSARYCYSVWLRHLVKAYESGLAGSLNRVAELGPGDSFGIGLAAMLSGADEYYPLDARKHARTDVNLRIFAELIELFNRREPIPDEVEFPLISPRLSGYAFPANILTENMLNRNLSPDRVAAITAALKEKSTNSGIRICYIAPWDESSLMERGIIDMAFSQAVLEHVRNVAPTYSSLYQWLRPGGFMSHAIDFKCHGTTHDWHGHWTVSDFAWNVVQGNRPYLINRLPYSSHVTAIKEAGFRVVAEVRREGSPLPRHLLADRFKSLTDEDLRTTGVFIQAIKPSQLS